MKKTWKKVSAETKSFINDHSGLEFWEYMVFAIVMGLVVWAMKPLLLDLFTTIITTLKMWWTGQIGH
jgi:hypothetical protein